MDPPVIPPVPAAPTPGLVRPQGDQQNPYLHADRGDKVTNMLRSSFIDEAIAAGRMGNVLPLHKLGLTQLSPCSGDCQTMPSTVFRISSIVPKYDPE
jgi:hypothetical protein